MKREILKNKKFKNVKSKLEYIQKQCPETELFEDLKVLFKQKNFSNVYITHGSKEYGKDLVFSKFDNAFEEEKWCAAIVKNKNATQNDFIRGNEIANQIELAFSVPYKDNLGNEKRISKLFIIINGKVTDNARDVISKYVSPNNLESIKVWDYQDLREQIEKYSEIYFMDSTEPYLNLYIKRQLEFLSAIDQTNKVFGFNFDDIEDVFVNVQTSYSKELRKMNDYVTYDEKDTAYKEEDIEGSNEIIASNKNFIVHGMPTSGKTLFLKRIGIKALKKDSVKPTAVFYFNLHSLDVNYLDIAALLEGQFFSITEGEKFVEAEFEKVIVLLDSIDFIEDIERKTKFYNQINNFASSHGQKYQLILATRNLNFIKSSNLLTNFEETELLPFNFKQALTLVKKIIPNNRKKTNQFIEALKSSHLNTSLHRTPLSLTLLAILYRDDEIDLKELPANIYALYDLFTEVYLNKWDSNKGIAQLFKFEQTRSIIALIAFYLHDNGENKIDENKLKNLLIKMKKDYDFVELSDVDKFLVYLKTRNGVFYYNEESKSFSFFNHYFQEFFTSLAIHDEDESILIDNFFDDWWANSLVFRCGKEPRRFTLHDKILKKIVPINIEQKYKYLLNHSKCLQASHSIPVVKRSKVVIKLLNDFNIFIEELVEQAKDNKESLISKMPFVNFINQSRSLFDTLFSSQHISKKETLELFYELLEANPNRYATITLYNIAYFLAFYEGNPRPLEKFESQIGEDIVWNRVLYVDINFLRLKKKVDEKTFIRIKRKMKRKKFQIQHILKDTVINKSQL